jgi:2,5-dihydroxypyridine 5,6-dioxygenase
VWDETVTADLVEAFRAAAALRGVRAYVFTYEGLSYHPMAEIGLFAGSSRADDGIRVPPGLAAVLRSVPAIVFATSDLELLMFSRAFREALSAGTRGVSLPYLTTESALRLLPESVEEVEALRARTASGGDMLSSARQIHVSSRAGTELTMSVGRYEGRTHDGVPAPGRRQTLPAGQVTRVPDDGSAHGVLVIDRSIAANDYRRLPEPVRFTVESGYVTAVEGGSEADRLRLWLAEQEDPEVYHLTELAFGTNQRCRLTGVAAPVEDTHTAGCVSFALGADVHIGGRTNAAAHIDMTMFSATLELDGRAIVRDGVLLI